MTDYQGYCLGLVVGGILGVTVVTWATLKVYWRRKP